MCIEIKDNYLDQKANENLERLYNRYANEVIEIAIKMPFNLLETIEKTLRSPAS